MAEEEQEFLTSDVPKFKHRGMCHDLTGKTLMWGGSTLLVVLALTATIIVLAVENASLKNKATGTSEYRWLQEDMLSKMDTSIDPCEDFYSYSCGKFVKDTTLPDGVSAYIPTFDLVYEKNYELLKHLATDQWPYITEFYDSCMNVDNQATIQSLVQTIQSDIFTLQSNNLTDVMPLLGNLHKMGVDAFFAVGVLENIFEANSSMYLILEQSGISSSDPSSYKDPQFLSSLTSAVSQILGSLFSLTPSQASSAATAVVALETKLANSFGGGNTFEDILQVSTYGKFEKLLGTSLDTYLNKLGLETIPPSTTTLLLSVDTFFNSTNLPKTIATTDVQTIQFYLSWRLILAYVLQYNVLIQSSKFARNSPEFVDLSEFQPTGSLHALKSKLHPAFIDYKPQRLQAMAKRQDSMPRQEICIQMVDTFLGDFVGHIFSDMVVNNGVVGSIQNITEAIKTAFNSGLPELTWIDDYSKSAASFKLSKIIEIIGHPNVLSLYDGLELNSDYYSNLQTMIAFQMANQLKTLGTPFDRSAYQFSATIVNAFYSPLTNTINFPAGILESPMYSVTFPKMLQYARMGYVIGHETTHSLDNSGRMWNAYGVYEDIFDEESSKNFNEVAQCMVDQYSKYEVVNGVYLNGEQTLGENIADNGGIKNAYRAYQAYVKANGAEFQTVDTRLHVDKLNNDQLFWVMLGQTWCEKATDAALEEQVQTDVHSTSKWRVNGPLSNYDQFSKAFSCKSGSAMNPKNKCTVW